MAWPTREEGKDWEKALERGREESGGKSPSTLSKISIPTPSRTFNNPFLGNKLLPKAIGMKFSHSKMNGLIPKS